MLNTIYPSLTETGFISNPIEVADFLISDFYTSEYSQSLTAFGQVASLQYLIRSNQNDMDGLERMCQSILTDYFTRYFKEVNVSVNVTKIKDSDRFELSIGITFKDNLGNDYSLNKILESTNSRFFKIIEKIN